MARRKCASRCALAITTAAWAASSSPTYSDSSLNASGAHPGELRAGYVVHHSPHDAHQRVLKGVLPVQIPSEVTELLS